MMHEVCLWHKTVPLGMKHFNIFAIFNKLIKHYTKHLMYIQCENKRKIAFYPLTRVAVMMAYTIHMYSPTFTGFPSFEHFVLFKEKS